MGKRARKASKEAMCEDGVCTSNDTHWKTMCKKHHEEWQNIHDRWNETKRTGIDNYIPLELPSFSVEAKEE